MARHGEKFLEEERTCGARSPGIVEDDEELERRLPLEGKRLSAARFRRDFRWTEKEGGASVNRCAGWNRRPARNVGEAKAGNIRGLADADDAERTHWNGIRTVAGDGQPGVRNALPAEPVHEAAHLEERQRRQRA